MVEKMGPVTLENVRLIFRNFSGAEGQFNRAGARNFAIALDPEIARQMRADGWNVKQLRVREEGDVPQDYLEVAVNYSSGKPPRIVTITSRGRTNVTEDTVMILDWAEIQTADLILNPYPWEVNGNAGVKAYLKSLFVTIREDELDLKYAGVPDSPVAGVVSNTPWEE